MNTRPSWNYDSRRNLTMILFRTQWHQVANQHKVSKNSKYFVKFSLRFNSEAAEKNWFRPQSSI